MLVINYFSQTMEFIMFIKNCQIKWFIKASLLLKIDLYSLKVIMVKKEMTIELAIVTNQKCRLFKY